MLSRLQVNVVMAVQNARPDSELARIFAHPGHMGGADGIFIGAHPRPRARGTFARYLREYVRETATWSWPEAVHHLADFAECNEAYAEYFAEPYPVRTTVGSQLADILVEIDVIAAIPG